jgi:TatD DNase family protein
MMVDSHSHIYSKEFDSDRQDVIERAKKEGVRKILMPAIDTEMHEIMLQTERENPAVCFSMMGLHPCSVKQDYLEELKIVGEYLAKRSFIAIGETGLDFYWDKTFLNEQYSSFQKQIEWALQYDIPVVIHSRNSIDECIDEIRKYQSGKLKGVFHCFSGNLRQAQQIIELGFYLGIGGVVTFKNAGLDILMKELGLDNVVLETDAPYLSPVPFRGKRNESSYIKYVSHKLAEIKSITVEEVAMITTKNATKLFGEL